MGFSVCFRWNGGKRKGAQAIVIFAQLLPSIPTKIFVIVVIWFS